MLSESPILFPFHGKKTALIKWVVTKRTFLKGYFQVALTERASEVSAFVMREGLYQFRVLPFGMKNAPATFQ